MTKKELSRLVSDQTQVSQKDVEKVLTALPSCLSQVLFTGENVFLRGFGTFTTKVRKARPARNITKGIVVMVPEKTVPSFRFSKEFK